MKRLAQGLILVLIPVLFVFLLAEVLLRIEPSLISLTLLERFPSKLRSEIATSLGLPNKAEYNVILSSDRHDKGRDLYLPLPNASYFTPAEPADKAAGAIEHFTVDAKGYCNPPGKAETAKTQVVVLGGSVPSCAGVDAASVFSAQLGDITGLATYDMTVGGVGPLEYLEVFRRDGLALKPEIVVMAFSEANDLRDCQRHADHLSGRLPATWAAREWGFPFSVSYSLSFVKAAIELLVKQAKAGASEDFTYTISIDGTLQSMNIRNGDLDELQSARAVAGGSLSPGICETALSDFVALARANSFVPLVMATPASYVVYGNSADFTRDGLNKLMTSYGKVQRDWLEQNAERIGYVFIDPLPGMQGKAEHAPLLFFPSNAHLTIAGHRALAEAAAPLVMKALGATP